MWHKKGNERVRQCVIYLIDGRIVGDSLIDLSHDLERIRLLVVVSVGTDTKVQLDFSGVSLVSQSGSQNRIRGSELDVREEVSSEAIVLKLQLAERNTC